MIPRLRWALIKTSWFTAAAGFWMGVQQAASGVRFH